MTHRQIHALGIESFDAVDELCATPLLEPPPDFEQRVLSALPRAPAVRAASRRAWRWRQWCANAVLVVAGLAGLGEVVSALAGVWLAVHVTG